MRASFLISVLLAALAFAMPVDEALGQGKPRDRDRGRGQDREEVRRERGVSLDQAVAMVERRFKARVVRAETQRGEGGTVYVLRLLNDSGKVWTVRVDAESGRIR